VLIFAGCSSPRCESPTAQSLVTALRPQTQFRAMLKMFVERTQTFAMATAKDSSGTQKKLDAALDRAVERHGAEWERNLVAAWGTLNATELEKVCSVLGNKNDTTFMRFATRVAPEVKSKNQPLLERAATEILDEIWT